MLRMSNTGKECVSPASRVEISFSERKVNRPKKVQNSVFPKGSPHALPGAPHSCPISLVSWLKGFLLTASLSSPKLPSSHLPTSSARSKLLLVSIHDVMYRTPQIPGLSISNAQSLHTAFTGPYACTLALQ